MLNMHAIVVEENKVRKWVLLATSARATLAQKLLRSLNFLMIPAFL